MKRRDFLVLAGASAMLPRAVSAAPLDYAPGLLKKHLDAGETVFLDFTASWCSTCRTQDRVINALKAATPDYEANVTFINVDWDTYGRSQLVANMRIPRRSTLVVVKENKELGRIVADTRESRIRALMDIALHAAKAS